jgi:hypothetical protein
MAKCRSCRATVYWVRTTAHRLMPLDPHPSEHGNVVLERGEPARVVGAEEAARLRAEGRPLYVSHFTTCPQAAQWRRSPTTRDEPGTT